MRYSIYTLSASLSIALSQTPSLPELLQSQSDLSLLADALTVVPEFASTLAQSRNVTILAPTNAAFQALLAQGLNAENQAVSTRDPDGISTLIAYHVLKGTYLSTDFTQVPTYVNTELDQEFSIFGTIRSNVTDGQNVGLVLNGGNATIISGELQTSNVVQADIITIPGVTIHKIDKVLTIPLNLSDTLVRLPQVGVSGALGLLDTAGFIDRVDANGESDQTTLDIVEDITVFIPNNEALVSVASAFQGASNATLRSVLGYHAIQGAVVFASDVGNTTVKSVQGEDLTLTVGQDGTVYVDNARVVFPNILLSNGVAHVIDQVLNPATPQINRTGLRPSGTPDPVYTGASRVGTAIPFTRSAITPSTVISIPPLATTARFVNAGGAANATTTGATASRSAPPSQFTGAAARFNRGVGALLGLGAALVL